MTRQRALEIGWHLYGEQYKRGEFLVRMRSLLRRHGIAESLELPDHLSHCLLLLPRLEEREAFQFVRGCLRPGLERIRQGFEPENPYRYAIESLCWFLDRRFALDLVNPET
jgi:nitrate reductase assembly molybdenum cofactor insertion protein NarJ